MHVIQEQQDREMKKYRLCEEIFKTARNELYLNLRFLDVALSSLAFLPDGNTGSWGSDGTVFYYSPEYLLETYRRSPVLMNRGFLHQLFHCMFGHIWKGEGKRSGDWDLACDVAAEYLMDSLSLACVHRPLTARRRDWYHRLEEEMSVVTGERVYRILEPMDPSDPVYRRLVDEFRKDDHQFWRKPPKNPKQQNRRQEWEDIRDKIQTELEVFSKEAGVNPGGLEEALAAENRERYDYREFLQRFAVIREEMQVDPDSFDYIFYDYGMRLYGNMPLIEPLETREVQKIEDFVIVIDTSMSCKGELVKVFLEQTYQILSQTESFFRKINIRILQCDEKVQDDAKIENGEQLQDYMEHLEIRGLGGTDFRPPFVYVQELMAKKEFHKLKGLLYFTDGYGTYPVRMPPYDVAFVFLERDYKDVDVPQWAMKLILTEDEIVYEHQESKTGNQGQYTGVSSEK